MPWAAGWLGLDAAGSAAGLRQGGERVLAATSCASAIVLITPAPASYQPQVVAFATGASGTSATVINAHTGAVQQTLSGAGAPASELLPLPQPVHDGSADQHAYLLVPAAAGATVRVVPDTPQAQAAFQAARPGLSFWRVDERAGAIRGLGFTGEGGLVEEGCAGAGGGVVVHGACRPAAFEHPAGIAGHPAVHLPPAELPTPRHAESGAVEERWAAVLAPPGGPSRILTVAAHIPGEAVASPARVLGDGELRMKYLNPSALLAVAGPPRGSEGGRLTAAVLDGVTGRVLFSQAHEGASGPVHGVLSENTAAYHFWSAEQHRWQIASIELFDASPTTLKCAGAGWWWCGGVVVAVCEGVHWPGLHILASGCLT